MAYIRMYMADTKEFVIVADYSQDNFLSLDELAAICGVTPQQIQELISFAVLHPHGHVQIEWRFDSMQIKRAKRAFRLQRDLEVNVAGIALALDLMDELDALRTQLHVLKKHYGST